MIWHFIEGEEGCAYAVRHGCVAIIVDALRASATAAYMLNAGATEILAVREVEEAFSLAGAYPDALLAGERGGLPPRGFDLGNSPRSVSKVNGRRVIFTTTTGAGRLVQSWGAHAVYMGSTVNATAVARAAASHQRDVVVVPAGLMSDASYNAQEDWVGSVAVAMAAATELGPLEIGEGGHRYTYWHDRILCDGIEKLFQTAPHAQNLREIGQHEDIAFCAGIDTIATVPVAVERNGLVVRVVAAD
ncbi:MAG TPA: 2-phosphosulfolactate phosphatase [Candidatus Hydrogenedentes bacterium]|nr:2-phosphosulfolactate phosphatase [Candidatus Hydrogenedentota bacterium]HRK33265.1 2-phosphosulfolactate phosphatase [Candidatus Hydrogenedentota bacterium]